MPECVKVESPITRSEEHTSELQSLTNLVCRLLLEKKTLTGIGFILAVTIDNEIGDISRFSTPQRLACYCSTVPWVLFFFNDTATTEIYTLSLHDALPISNCYSSNRPTATSNATRAARWRRATRSEEHTSELQSRSDLVCRLLLEKKK